MKRFPLPFVIFALTFPLSLSAADQEYPRKELLLEATELAKPEIRTMFVILDVRSEEAFRAGHIPSAHRVDHDVWKAAFDDGKDIEDWKRRIGGLGITSDTKVVLYDDAATKNAARIWWLLHYWGVKDVRLLNGGWRTWAAMKLPTSTDPPPLVKSVLFDGEPQTKTLTTKEDIFQHLKSPSLQIVDTRSFGEFCGTEPLKNKRGGAIPGAVHLEWSDLIGENTHRFKSASEIKQLFAKAGIDVNRPVAAHCQSGGRASVMAFGLELMGAKDVRNYYPGWSEWGNLDAAPIERPKPKE